MSRSSILPFALAAVAGCSQAPPPRRPVPPASCRYGEVVRRAERAFASMPGHERWSLALTPPLPTNYPQSAHGMFTVLAFAYAPSDAPDAMRVAAPWARLAYRVGDPSEVAIEITSKELRDIGRQGFRPVAAGDRSTPESLADACHEVDVVRTNRELPSDLRDRYCGWVASNGVIAAAVRGEDAAFFDALRCGPSGK